MSVKSDLGTLRQTLERKLAERGDKRSFVTELMDAAFGEGEYNDADPRLSFEAVKLGLAYQYGKPRETIDHGVSEPETLSEAERSFVDDQRARWRSVPVATELKTEAEPRGDANVIRLKAALTDEPSR